MQEVQKIIMCQLEDMIMYFFLQETVFLNGEVLSPMNRYWVQSFRLMKITYLSLKIISANPNAVALHLVALEDAYVLRPSNVNTLRVAAEIAHLLKKIK